MTDNDEIIINEKCNELAEIICDFRNGEITRIDADHVKRWIRQFEDSSQIPILEEMIYVFSSNENKINDYADCENQMYSYGQR